MESGAEVWVRDVSGSSAWLPGVVTAKDAKSDGGHVLSVTLSSDGESRSYVLSEGDDEELEDIKLRNDSASQDVENLINLPHLHEPAILFCLEQRYKKSDIYTYTGPILIAVNPFKRVPLYTTQILETYYNAGLLKSQGIDAPTVLGPHIYAVADASYRNMMTVIHAGHAGAANRDFSANQAILISGESGAGKTESTKIVLRYLTTVGNSSGGVELADGSVMDKVLQSNPILESFGNAKTIRNDNSSRFGKFIELNFNKRGHLIGGTIRTYLLEKVRLSAQQTGERNFHVFYQMLAGADEEQLRKWHALDIKEYFYTSQGGVYKLRDFDDAHEYSEMRRALCTLSFSQADQTTLFQAMAGILHLGQLQFVPDRDGEGCDIAAGKEGVKKSLESSVELLGISTEQLVRTLTTRVITTRDESVDKKLTVREALAARDALSKAIYGRLFNWVVQTINMSIQVEASLTRADIGVLDIFGFENFKSNSFEQLCINYTNETLQQQFNQFVFKMEQLEYKKEQIEWSFISFPDNQDCLDLIDHKLNGILAMIDDECRLPRATDEKLAARMYKALEANSRFSATAPQRRDSMFCVKHYAGPVVYCTITFVEKNKDELPKEAVSLMVSSSLQLLSDIFVQDPIPDYTLAMMQKQQQSQIEKSIDKKLSVGAQFKQQLGTLMEKIYSTKPHYIRCLKPNDQNVSDNFNRMRTTEQLRYGGVLEAVRVARSGFPVRLGHGEFFARYRPLANPFVPATKKLPRVIADGVDAKSQCETLLGILWGHEKEHFPANRNPSRLADLMSWLGPHSIPQESVQLGLSKIFLRKQAHDLLEARRVRRLAGASRTVQSVIRCQKVRKTYLLQLWAIRVLQRVVRGLLGRKQALFKRQTRSARLIQSSYRMRRARFKYLYFRFAVISLQSLFRGRMAHKSYQLHLYILRGAKLCRLMRCLSARRRLTKVRKAVIALQCRLRQQKAKRLLKSLRVEAKDVGKLKQSNEQLKAEIEMLRSRARLDAEEKAKELAAAAEHKALERVSVEQKAQVERVENELKILKDALAKETALHVETEELLRDRDVQLVETQKLLEDEKLAHASTQANQLRMRDTGSPASANLTPRGSIVCPSKADEILLPGDSIGSLESMRSQLSAEREAKALLEEEVARLRRISMDLTAQMDTLRRNQMAAAAAGSVASVTAGVTRRPDENPRRRYMVSTSSSVTAKSKADIDSTKKVAVGLRLTKVEGTSEITSKEDSKEESLEERVDTESSTVVQDEERGEREKANVAMGAAASKFNKNLAAFRQKLQQGILINLWEGGRVESKFETKMRLSPNNSVVSFEDPKARKRNFVGGVFAYFGAREEVAPVKVTDIFECFSSGDKQLLEGSSQSGWLPASALESKSEHTLLTLVAKSEGDVPRTLVIQLSSKEERNHVVSGIRMMINTNPLFQSQPQPHAQTPPKRPSATSSIATSPVDPQRPARRAGKRDEVENTKSRRPSDGPATPEAVFERPISSNASSLLADMQLMSVLQDERINSERLRTQAVVFQNELHERDEEIRTLKKSQAVLEQALGAKQKMFDQLNAVQMQISRKLEQTLLDKEEACEINDVLQQEIIELKHKFLQAAGLSSPSTDLAFNTSDATPPPPVLSSIEGRGRL